MDRPTASQMTARTDFHIQRAQSLLYLIHDSTMLSMPKRTIMYFVFLTSALAAYLTPLELVKYERLVLVRNGAKIALSAAPEFCSSFDPKIF
jgi:hypothetical protein